MSNLPPIFIESSSHCGGLVEYDMGPRSWDFPEGKFVRAEDYLALRAELDHATGKSNCEDEQHAQGMEDAFGPLGQE